MNGVHTKGPWRAYGAIVRDVDGSEDQICEVSNVGTPEGTANARLISAAPVLLDALKGFVETMKGLPISDETSGRVWGRYHEAVSAINEAEGGAS